MTRSRHSIVLSLLFVSLAPSATARADEENTSKTTQPLAVDRTVTLWTSRGGRIPVCWATAGFEREKDIVRQAVRDTWEYYADLSFTGWGDCPTRGDVEQVRVGIQPHDASDAGAGGRAALGTNALSRPGGATNVNLGFNPDGSADKQRVEYVGVHEFGHVLGFVHEQDLPGNVEGPAHCDQTKGVDPNGVPVTAYDRNSVMNYCNADGNGQGRLTDIDILGVRGIYGTRTHFVPSAVVLLGDGQIWRFTGRPCVGGTCPGWERIDTDRRIKTIAASESRLFARQGTGQIWAWDGHTACTGTACRGWTLIDSSTRSTQIVASGDTVYQLQVGGKVWKWDGRTPCTSTACPGWTLIDDDATVTSIAASDSKLFARQASGHLWTWDGRSPCDGAACPGWAQIDAGTRSTEIAASGSGLFQRQVDGKVWQWDRQTVCKDGKCMGWELVDNDARIKNIAASGKKLFARLGTGQVWAWDGQSRCTSTACPGWTQIDANTRSRQIAAAGDSVLQLQVDGTLWKWDGETACSGQSCPGWVLINRDGRLVDVQAFVPVSAPSRLSSGSQF